MGYCNARMASHSGEVFITTRHSARPTSSKITLIPRSVSKERERGFEGLPAGSTIRSCGGAGLCVCVNDGSHTALYFSSFLCKWGFRTTHVLMILTGFVFITVCLLKRYQAACPPLQSFLPDIGRIMWVSFNKTPNPPSEFHLAISESVPFREEDR